MNFFYSYWDERAEVGKSWHGFLTCALTENHNFDGTKTNLRMSYKSKVLWQDRPVSEFDCCFRWLIDGATSKIYLWHIKLHVRVGHHSLNCEWYWGSLKYKFIAYFWGYKTSFPFQKNPKNLDPSYKMDQDFWESFRREKKFIAELHNIFISAAVLEG